MSLLLYRCATWTLNKCMKKKLDGNYTRMLRAVLNESLRRQHAKQLLYGHLPPIPKTSLDEPDRQNTAGQGRNELISDILLLIPSYGREMVGRWARTYIQQLCADKGYSLEDHPGAMDNTDGWCESVREIGAVSATW